jgi:hypothetical protein
VRAGHAPSAASDTYDLPQEGTPEVVRDVFDGEGVRFRRGMHKVSFIKTASSGQNELVRFCALSGVRGLVRIPHEEKECARVLDAFRMFHGGRRVHLGELVARRTADEATQVEILEELERLL